MFHSIRFTNVCWNLLELLIWFGSFLEDSVLLEYRMGILDFIHIKVTKINLFDIIW